MSLSVVQFWMETWILQMSIMYLVFLQFCLKFYNLLLQTVNFFRQAGIRDKTALSLVHRSSTKYEFPLGVTIEGYHLETAEQDRTDGEVGRDKRRRDKTYTYVLNTSLKTWKIYSVLLPISCEAIVVSKSPYSLLPNGLEVNDSCTILFSMASQPSCWQATL